MSFKLDLHTHSAGSPDGGLKLSDYRSALQSGRLDYIAVTDHDSVDSALAIQAALQELGSRIIIGEEIMTDGGEIIGLYLSRKIDPGQSPAETAAQVHAQGGLVYVPHPFETIRSGLSVQALDEIADAVDIIEISNGRAVFQNRGPQAAAWARRHDKPGAAASDSHGRRGWGRTYSIIAQPPTPLNVAQQLGAGRYKAGKVGIGILYPKLNRLRRKVGHGAA